MWRTNLRRAISLALINLSIYPLCDVKNKFAMCFLSIHLRCDELISDVLNLPLFLSLMQMNQSVICRIFHTPRVALHYWRVLERRRWLACRFNCFICFLYVYFKGQSLLVVVLMVESCAYHYRQSTRVMGFRNRQCLPILW